MIKEKQQSNNCDQGNIAKPKPQQNEGTQKGINGSDPGGSNGTRSRK